MNSGNPINLTNSQYTGLYKTFHEAHNQLKLLNSETVNTV